MNAPCKDCEKRAIGCHGTCPDYIKFRKERDEMNAKARFTKENLPNPKQWVWDMKRKEWWK